MIYEDIDFISYSWENCSRIDSSEEIIPSFARLLLLASSFITSGKKSLFLYPIASSKLFRFSVTCLSIDSLFFKGISSYNYLSGACSSDSRDTDSSSSFSSKFEEFSLLTY